jgi:hypothetical protein
MREAQVASLTNPWCAALGIRVPALEAVTDHREANV